MGTPIRRPTRSASTEPDRCLHGAGASDAPIVAPDALIRALELARALNHPEQIEEIGGLMIELAGSSMEDEAWAPGVPLVLLTALGQLPAETRPGELGELLERAKARFGSDPYTVQSVIELQAALNRDDPERERELHAQMVDRFREAGREASGVLRVAHLEHALELAREHGLRDELEALRRELQEIGPEGRWKLPTRFETKTTSLGFTRGIAIARSTSSRSSRGQRSVATCGRA